MKQTFFFIFQIREWVSGVPTPGTRSRPQRQGFARHALCHSLRLTASVSTRSQLADSPSQDQGRSGRLSPRSHERGPVEALAGAPEAKLAPLISALSRARPR